MEPLLALTATAILFATGLALACTRPARPLPLAAVVARRRVGARTLAEPGLCAEVADAAARCRACPDAAACRRWLAADRAEPCPSFCPSRSLIERIDRTGG